MFLVGFWFFLINDINLIVLALYCHMHNSYSEAAFGSDIISSQTPSNNTQTICFNRKSHK